jgi:uncharacterized protein
VTTTAKDAVVSIKVTDVAPDGSSKELSGGWLAASMRAVDASRSRTVRGKLLQPWHPFTRASVLPVEAGKPTELPVEVFPVNAVILKGHSLRVSVGPGDFPHATPPLPQLANELGGQVQILHDPEHPSALTMPTIGTSCAVTPPKAVAHKKKAAKRHRRHTHKRKRKHAKAKRSSALVEGCPALPVPRMLRG